MCDDGPVSIVHSINKSRAIDDNAADEDPSFMLQRLGVLLNVSSKAAIADWMSVLSALVSPISWSLMRSSSTWTVVLARTCKFRGHSMPQLEGSPGCTRPLSVRTCSQLRFDNVVAIHALGLLEGYPLRPLLKRLAVLDLSRPRRAFIQLAVNDVVHKLVEQLRVGHLL